MKHHFWSGDASFTLHHDKHARLAQIAMIMGAGGHDGRGFLGGRGGRGKPGRGDFDGGDHGMPGGRKFSSDDLQLLLLALLAEAPAHGYELIRALQTRSNGFYSPSPGMVYPALTYLEELGHVTVEQVGNRKQYSLADSGRDYLAEHQHHIERMFARLTHFARKMDSVRRAFSAGSQDEESESRDGANWLPEFIEARRALKYALLLRGDIGAIEQQRIAAILASATAAIEKVAAPSRHDVKTGRSDDETPQ